MLMATIGDHHRRPWPGVLDLGLISTGFLGGRVLVTERKERKNPKTQQFRPLRCGQPHQKKLKKPHDTSIHKSSTPGPTRCHTTCLVPHRIGRARALGPSSFSSCKLSPFSPFFFLSCSSAHCLRCRGKLSPFSFSPFFFSPFSFSSFFFSPFFQGDSFTLGRMPGPNQPSVFDSGLILAISRAFLSPMPPMQAVSHVYSTSCPCGMLINVLGVLGGCKILILFIKNPDSRLQGQQAVPGAARGV